MVGLDSRAENGTIDSESATELIEGIAEELDVNIYDDKRFNSPDYPAPRILTASNGQVVS